MSATVVIPRRALVVVTVAVAVAALVVGLILVPGPREALGRAVAPRLAADAATIDAQRVGVERSIQRGFAKAGAQLRQVRALTLAIGPSEADAIEAKARDDLRSIRREALRAVGTAVGLTAPALDAYLATAETQLDQGSFEQEAGVLLAPALFDIVRRAGELFQQTADAATRELTRAASPSPTRPSTPSPRPSPSPTGS